jgi:hypothetical protein
VWFNPIGLHERQQRRLFWFTSRFRPIGGRLASPPHAGTATLGVSLARRPIRLSSKTDLE